MRLFKLAPEVDWEPWYDKAFGFVVRAKNEAEARRLVSANGPCGDEGSDVWLDPSKTICVELAEDGEAEIILVDFRAA